MKAVSLFEHRRYCQHCQLKFKDSSKALKAPTSADDFYGFDVLITLIILIIYTNRYE